MERITPKDSPGVGALAVAVAEAVVGLIWLSRVAGDPVSADARDRIYLLF